MTTEVYGTSPLKRHRRTNAELAKLNTALYDIADAERPVTIRGLFYRMVTRGLVPKTDKGKNNGYGVVQRQVLKMRRAGELPYDWIADGTRWQIRPTTYRSAERALSALSSSYRRALWDDQYVHVELWVEKDAIASVVSGVTAEWDVPLLVARGFSSETFLYDTAQDIISDGVPAVIYQLGDHDPSGVAAWEHTKAKLTEFAPEVEFEFERLAVTPEQITELDLPTRPTKKTDTRAAKFEGESVEVDAVPSQVLRRTVQEAITSHIDTVQLEITRSVEASERQWLENLTVG